MTRPANPPKVLIIVSGGVVQDVIVNKKEIEVTLLDHDDLGCAEDLDSELIDAYLAKLIADMGKKPIHNFFDPVLERDVRGTEEAN